jgi:23S rRNA pseudouridine1911/1915/1917 synthase
MAKHKRDLRRIHVPPAKAGMRLDRFLAEVFPDVSRRRLQEVLRQGEVRIDGDPVRPGRILAGGEELTLPAIRQALDRVKRDRREKERLRRQSAPPGEVLVIHRDEHLLVVTKPAGMPVHGGANLGAVTTLLEAIEADVVAGYGLVHRLDRDTSGLLALVRGEEARKATAERFAEVGGAVEKEYEALVDGVPASGTGEIDLPLSPPDRRGMVRVDHEAGRAAVTRYTVLERFGTVSRLRVRLLTGRTHQIRIHLAAIGHPLLVDPRYGIRRGWRLVDPRGRLDARLKRTPLHAARLALPHPATGEVASFEAPLAGDIRYALEVLRVDAGRRRKEDSISGGS